MKCITALKEIINIMFFKNILYRKYILVKSLNKWFLITLVENQNWREKTRSFLLSGKIRKELLSTSTIKLSKLIIKMT